MRRREAVGARAIHREERARSRGARPRKILPGDEVNERGVIIKTREALAAEAAAKKPAAKKPAAKKPAAKKPAAKKKEE